LPVCALIDVLLKNLNLCGTGRTSYSKKDEMGPGENFANKKPEASGKEGMQKVNCGNAFWKGL